MSEEPEETPSQAVKPGQPPPNAEGQPTVRLCPCCGQPLVPQVLGGVWAEVCSQHGAWFAGTPEQLFPGASRKPGATAKATAAVLCGLQILGVSGSVVAAAVEIKSVLLTGPVFSLVGLLVALGCVVSRSVSNLLFGLSAAAMSLFCLVWIIGSNWSPESAQAPVSSALIGYELLFVPVGCLALYRTLRSPERRVGKDRPWQFSILQLLVLTAVLAAAMGIGRLAYEYGHDVRVGVAVGLVFPSLAGIGMAVVKGIAARDEAAVLPGSQPESVAAQTIEESQSTLAGQQ